VTYKNDILNLLLILLKELQKNTELDKKCGSTRYYYYCREINRMQCMQREMNLKCF